MPRLGYRFPAFAIIAALTAVFPAFAGDQSVPASSFDGDRTMWTGTYVGAHVGFARGDADWTYKNINPFSAVDPFGPLVVPGAGFSPEGLMAGGQIGQNFQFNRFVAGIEVSFSGMDLETTSLNGGQFFLPIAQQLVSTDISDLLMVTGKLGWLFDRNWLGYVKGGFARAQVETRGFLDLGIPIFDFTTRDHQNGWALGGGVEYKLGPNIGLALEYMHVDLGEQTRVGDVPFLAPQFAVVHDVDVSLDTVTMRLNLYLNAPPP